MEYENHLLGFFTIFPEHYIFLFCVEISVDDDL